MKKFVITLILTCILSNLVQAQESGYLFWSIVDTAEVWRSKLDTPLAEKITAESFGEGVELDFTNNKVYWINSGHGAIRRANLDGSNQETLIEFEGVARRIVLDIANNKMYWLETTKLRRANLDGSSPEDLVTSLSGIISGLDLDFVSGHAYFYAGGLYRSDLEGTNLINILPGNILNNVTDIAVDEVNAKIYYSAASNLGMRRSDLDGNNIEILFNDGEPISEVKVIDSKLFYVRGNNSSHIYSSNLDGSNVQIFYTSTGGILLEQFAIDFIGNKIYFETNNGDLLVKSDTSGANTVSIMATVGEQVHDVAVSADGKQLFFASQYNANNYSESIRISDFGGQDIHPQIFDSNLVGKIRGITYDYITEKVYWIDAASSSLGAIKRMDADGTNFIELVSGLNKAHDMTLDLVAGKMYWTENTGSGNSLTAKISCADLDGNNVTDVISGLPQGIRGISIDVLTKILYFTDQSNDVIMQVDTSGNNLTTVISAVNPHGIAVDNNTSTLYWSEGIGDSNTPIAKIRKSDLDGNNAIDFMTDINDYLRDITLVYVDDVLFVDGFEAL